MIAFEEHRPRLLGLAYRMLGSVEDAEDVVQEAYLRWHAADAADVRSPRAWLTTVVTRLSIDRLRRARTERAAYVGHWLPEPFATDPPAAVDRPAEIRSDLSTAFLLLLERLSPEERAAFLLRDVFDAGYDEIAQVIDRTETTSRQIVHRARTRVREDHARFAVPPEATARLLDRLIAALAAEDQEALLQLVSDEAAWTSDGGGRVPATRNIIRGRSRIMRLLLGLRRKERGRLVHTIQWLNGEPAIVSHASFGVFCTTSVASDGSRFTSFYRVLNPDKLRRVSAAEGSMMEAGYA